MSGAMNRHCIPGLTMSNSPDGELLRSVLEYQNDALQGLARIIALHYANAPVL